MATLSLCLATASAQPADAPDEAVTATQPTATQPAATQPAAAPPMDRIDLLTREQWRAKPPLDDPAMVPHTPSAITLHHTATPQNPDRAPGQALRNLQAFSQREAPLASGATKAAWADVPYHFYIHPTGTIVQGRHIDFQGDSNTKYDLADQVQVVLEGNFEIERPTDRQLESLDALILALVEQYDIPADRIRSHGVRAEGKTLCPGQALQAEMPGLRARVAKHHAKPPADHDAEHPDPE
jgi:hypothetical protein